jgi:tetratricopeptide (TPR) repeat protein
MGRKRVPAFTFAVALSLAGAVSAGAQAQDAAAGKAEADSLYTRGTSRGNANDYAGAVEDLTRAIDIYEQSEAVRGLALADGRLLDAYYNRGNIQYRRGILDAAIADFTEVIEINPNHAKAYNDRGNARDDKGDRAGAIADQDRAIEIDSQYAKAYYDRAITRRRSPPTVESLNATLADLTKAIELLPGETEFFRQRGGVRLQAYVLGRNADLLAGAIADLDNVLVAAPTDAPAYVMRGMARRHRKEFELAVADFGSAIGASPTLAAAYMYRGLVRLEQRLDAAAEPDFRKALELQPVLKAELEAAAAAIRRARK